jgi:hypothetical protein
MCSSSSMGQSWCFSLALSRIANVYLLSCHRTVFAIRVVPEAMAYLLCPINGRTGRCYDELSFVSSTQKTQKLCALL